MKKLPAIIAAFGVTCLVGLMMLVVGVNAYFNPNSVAVDNQPGDAAQIAVTGNPVDQVQQLQARIQEYQAREQQVQQQLNQASQQIEQANSELNQYQQLIANLQEMGVVRIDRDGNVSLPRFDRGDD